MPADPVALDDSFAPGVEDVDEPAVDCDAGRELAARRDDLAPLQPVAVHLERRHGVAASVDGDQQRVPRVVCERALRREEVGLGSRGGGAAVAAGGVNAGLREAAVVGAIEDDDLVAAQVLRLDPDDGSASPVPVAMPAFVTATMALTIAVAVTIPVARIGGPRTSERRDRGHEDDE